MSAEVAGVLVMVAFMSAAVVLAWWDDLTTWWHR